MNMPGERALRVGDGWFDPVGGDLTLGGRTLRLRPRTAALFAHLLLHPDRIVGKDELMQAVWPDVVVTEDSLVQCVKEIRQALGERGRDWIRTVPRQGYAFVDREAGQPAAAPAAAGTSMPRRAGWLVAALLSALLAGVLAWQQLRPPPPASAPAIMVLPLANRTQGAVADDVVDEFTETLTASLSRVPGTLVIASGTAFTFKGQVVDARRAGTELGVRYVLEGSLQQQPPRLALDMRLVDASNATQVWSERFQAEPGDTAALRDEVLARVANSLGLRLMRVEADRSRRERPRDPGAADLQTRALAALRWSGQGEEGIKQARQLLEQAVQRDPQLAGAWSLLAMTYLDHIRFSAERGQLLQRASEAAERARVLAPDTPLTQEALGKVFYNQGNRMAQALAAFDRGIELSPNDPVLHSQRAATLGMLGRASEGLPEIERAIRLSPRDPLLPNWLMIQGALSLHLKRDGDAVQVLERSVQANPRSVLAHLYLASAYGLTGATEAARTQVAHLQASMPGFTISRMREREPSDDPAYRAQREHLYDGLRRAGLPD